MVSGRLHRSQSSATRARPAAGWRIVVPGLPQWTWGQRGRGLVLFGTHLAALGIGLFAWGTPIGGLILAFSVAAHVASAADVVRQSAFPGFGRAVTWASASTGVGLCGYGPALALGAALAWPAAGPVAADGSFAVNRLAYRREAPRAGEWIWLAAEPGGRPAIGRVVATPGQRVAWVDGRLHIDGREANWNARPDDRRLRSLGFEVPEGMVLVAPGSPVGPRVRTTEPTVGGLVLVDRDRVAGRAWARIAPIWGRRLLP